MNNLIENLIIAAKNIIQSATPIGNSEISKNGAYLGTFKIHGYKIELLKDALDDLEAQPEPLDQQTIRNTIQEDLEEQE